ncbi:MAG: ABC transporter ATP-binding protein [Spirochaetota bacterium]
MIELSGIRREYEDFELDLSFRVSDDELVTLLGPSGSGKTTTLRIIAGFEYADAGTLTVDGRDISRLPPRERDIGYVFQDYALFPHLDVAENIAYGLRVHRVPALERRRRVEELLELIGLPGFGPRPVHTLSGGEQQRVAVARALARRPRALLLDEPFSSVDPERREELLEYLLRLQRSFSIPTLFVTHTRGDALAISDRIVIMREGRIDDLGPPRRLYDAPASSYTARALGPAVFLDPEGTRMVRPERIEITGIADPNGREAGSPDDVALGHGHEHAGCATSAPPPASAGEGPPTEMPLDTPVDGVVVRAIFRGAWLEYRVETTFGTVPVIDRAAFSIGDAVRLRIPGEGVVRLDADRREEE